MQGVYKERFKGLIVFIGIFMLSFVIFYGAYRASRSPGADRDVLDNRWLYEKPDPLVPADRIILTLGQPLQVGDNRYVFLGLKHGRIQIAVSVLALDPEYAYHHEITVREARQGLRLAGRDFKVSSYSGSRLVLAHAD